MVSADAKAFVRAALPPAPARVLEVGAGDGTLAALLRGAGYDVLAIDPAAEGDGVTPVALLDVDEPDGAIDEIDMERVDSAAAGWWIHQRAAAGRDHPEDPGAMLARLAGLHPLRTVLAGLAPHFALGEPVRCAYLHRWGFEPGLRDAEEDGIAAGSLPAVGAPVVGIRIG